MDNLDEQLRRLQSAISREARLATKMLASLRELLAEQRAQMVATDDGMPGDQATAYADAAAVARHLLREAGAEGVEMVHGDSETHRSEDVHPLVLR